MEETGRTCCDAMPTTNISDALDFIPFDSEYSEGDINLLSIIVTRAKDPHRVHRATMHLVSKLTNRENCAVFLKLPNSAVVLERMKRVTSEDVA